MPHAKAARREIATGRCVRKLVRVSDHGQANVDIAAGGVGIGADLVGLGDQRLGIRPGKAGQRDREIDVEAKAAFRARADADAGGEIVLQLTRQRNMLKEVPKADVVITNPTHYAVALLYDPAVATGPRVIAKGQDWLAFEIKRIARENDVPIEENPEVARAIYSAVEVGREIPENLYRAVSLIFAKLDKFKAVRS